MLRPFQQAAKGAAGRGLPNALRLQLLEAMAAERDDLLSYLDLFGYSPKYGVSGRRIASVTYRSQSYWRTAPLYQTGEIVTQL